ncbi:calcium-binding protein [Roseobacteraceae bacterium S113]
MQERVFATFSLTLDGLNLSPVSSVSALEAAIDAGIATGDFTQLTLTDVRFYSTVLATLTPTEAGYDIVQDELTISVLGALPSSAEEAFDIQELAADVEQALNNTFNGTPLTPLERTALLARADEFSLTGLTVSSESTGSFAALTLTDEKISIGLNGLTLEILGDFPASLSALLDLALDAAALGTADLETVGDIEANVVRILDENGKVLFWGGNLGAESDDVIVVDGETTSQLLLGTNDGDTYVSDTVSEDRVVMTFTGADFVSYDFGSSTVFGGYENDTLVGTENDDWLFGEQDNDSLSGMAGKDTLDGGQGNDMLMGGDNDDLLFGGAGNDTMHGDGGNDTLNAQEGNNLLQGGGGFDKLWGGSGSDTIQGGAGDDTLSGLQGDNFLDGQDGNDKIWGGNFNGFNETLRGGDGDDTLGGGRGDDIIIGQRDNDLVFSGNGNDTVFAGSGQDTVFGAGNADEIYGGDGADELYGDAGQDALFGGGGEDNLYGGTGSDSLDGGAEDDLLVGAIGFDVLNGGAGNDTLRGGASNDTMEGGDGDDIMNDFVGVDSWVFRDNDGNDTVNGFGADDRIVMLGGASEAQTHAEFIAASTDVGGNLVYDFGGDGLNVITITNYSVASFGFNQFDDVL